MDTAETGPEVIVHVYRQKEDPKPILEFSLKTRMVDGEEMVDIRQVEGRLPERGFMKITGVAPAGDVGVIRSDRYEISFSYVGNYKIYEKAVMDYLRQLPIPETAIDVEIEVNEDDLFQEEDPEHWSPGPETQDLGDIVLDATSDIEKDAAALRQDLDRPELTDELAADIPDSDEEPLDVMVLEDSLSAVVHVHRNENDIEPFKEFIVTMYRDQAGRKQANVVEVKGIKSGTRFIIMTGFEEREGEGVVQSFGYDVSSYNVNESEVYEQAVIEFMNGLNTAQFTGTEETIGLNWEEALAPKEAPAVKKEPKFQVSYSRKDRKQKEMSQRQIDKEAEKEAKRWEEAKYKAPKHKSKYGKKRSGRMSSRMAKFNKRKVQCPTIRGH